MTVSACSSCQPTPSPSYTNKVQEQAQDQAKEAVKPQAQVNFQPDKSRILDILV